MDICGRSLLVAAIILSIFNLALSLFFDDDPPRITKIRIHVFQPKPKIRPSRIVKHVHFNIHKPREEEVHVPHEVKIPITINPAIYHHGPIPHHQEYHLPAKHEEYHLPAKHEEYHLPLKHEDYHLPVKHQDYQHEYSDHPPPDYQPLLGDQSISLPENQLRDDNPYGMSQYNNEYSGGSGPSAGEHSNSLYPQHVSGSSANGVDTMNYNGYEKPPPMAYEDIKYPWR